MKEKFEESYLGKHINFSSIERFFDECGIKSLGKLEIYFLLAILGVNC
jgi:hypothetical protein